LAIDRSEGSWVGGYLVRADNETLAITLASQLRAQVRVNDQSNVGY